MKDRKMAYKLLEEKRWKGSKNGNYEIKNVTTKLNSKGQREYYIMLDYAKGWYKLCVDKDLNSYIRVDGQKLFLKDFVFENMFETVEA